MIPLFLRNLVPKFIRNLAPRRKKAETNEPKESTIYAFLHLKLVEWALLFVGWLAWTSDAVDLFSVGLSLKRLAESFHKDIDEFRQRFSPRTTAITLTLVFRSIGALLFGLMSDRYGRKWPLVINLVICSAIELASGYVRTYGQFLATRSLFGLFMGGVWGLVTSSSLEAMPRATRGLTSGILQQGATFGYLFAAVFNLKVLQNAWRALFWFAAAITFTAAVCRACLPESPVFLRTREDRRRKAEKKGGDPASEESKDRVFFHETRNMLKEQWQRFIYAVLLMIGLTFLGHGTQDFYPTYLRDGKRFGGPQADVATIIGSCGGFWGALIAGWASQHIGRRLAIIICICIVGAFIPLWTVPDGWSKLAAGAFCLQFGVQGAFGVIPIHLAEISPPAFRATFPGVAFQLGNLVSAASAQIQAKGGENWTIRVGDAVIPDYAKVLGVFVGVTAVYIVVVTLFGPEQLGRELGNSKVATEPGAGTDETAEKVEENLRGEEITELKRSDDEKA